MGWWVAGKEIRGEAMKDFEDKLQEACVGSRTREDISEGISEVVRCGWWDKQVQ